MKDFTFKKEFVGDSLSAHIFFKSFIVWLVMMLMTTNNAFAEVIDGLNYKIHSDTKTAILMLKTDGKYSGDIIVPEKVKASDGVEYSVVSFGYRCFADCVNLTSISIPTSVTSIGESCFEGCRSLTSITIPSSITQLGARCFENCYSLTSVVLPPSVTSLDDRCFYYCSRLTSITLPSSLRWLGWQCFYGCRSLTSITLPSSVTSLGESCFKYCYSLTSITIPPLVNSLEKECFEFCSNLTSITLPPSLKSLGNSCFYGCSRLTSISIPSSVISLGDCCFASCSSLTSVTLPPSVISLGNYCFASCSSLTSVTLPPLVNKLGKGFFEKCSSLTSVTLPPSFFSLDEDCFYECTSLTSITLPKFVSWVGTSCFSGCSNLKSLYLEGDLPGNLKRASIPTTCMLYVQTQYLRKCKELLAPDNSLISAWNPDGKDGDYKPLAQCDIPSISYESGEVKFFSETPGAKYRYTIRNGDLAINALNQDGKVSLSAACHIYVYATADGYAPSEKAEATLYWINANLETTNINPTKTRGIVAFAHDGIISISGLDNGEMVKFYAADGKLLGTSSAVGGVASCTVSEKMVNAKIGMDTIKVLMK